MTLEYIPMGQRPKFKTIVQLPNYRPEQVRIRLVQALGTVPPKFVVYERGEHYDLLRQTEGTADVLGIPEAVAKQATRDWPGRIEWPVV